MLWIFYAIDHEWNDNEQKKNPSSVNNWNFLFVCFSVHKFFYEYSSLKNDHMNMKFGMMKENDSPECRKKSGRDISDN